MNLESIFSTIISLWQQLWVFILEMPQHLESMIFPSLLVVFGVIYLLLSGHATLGGNHPESEEVSSDIGCGDTRVWRKLTIFGGPAGITFGLAYFWLMNVFQLQGWLKEYWSGFVYVQFLTSILQSFVFLMYCIFSRDGTSIFRRFKSHGRGGSCAWVTLSSPLMWPLYLPSVFAPKSRVTKVCTGLRNWETWILFLANIIMGPTLLLCFIGSIINRRIIYPSITAVDKKK